MSKAKHFRVAHLIAAALASGGCAETFDARALGARASHEEQCSGWPHLGRAETRDRERDE